MTLTTCIHEAGHAFVCAELGCSFEFVEALKGSARVGGIMLDEIHTMTHEAAILAAGACAEVAFYLPRRRVSKKTLRLLDESILNIGKAPVSMWDYYTEWSDDIRRLNENEFKVEGEKLAKEILRRPHAQAAVSALANALSICGRIKEGDARVIMEEAA
jgi:hypothetical protein